MRERNLNKKFSRERGQLLLKKCPTDKRPEYTGHRTN